MLLLAVQQFKFASQENPKYLDSFTGRGGPPKNLVYGARTEVHNKISQNL